MKNSLFFISVKHPFLESYTYILERKPFWLQISPGILKSFIDCNKAGTNSEYLINPKVLIKLNVFLSEAVNQRVI